MVPNGGRHHGGADRPSQASCRGCGYIDLPVAADDAYDSFPRVRSHTDRTGRVPVLGGKQLQDCRVEVVAVGWRDLATDALKGQR